jgi:hypothetical protein
MRTVIRGYGQPETSASPRRSFLAGRVPLDVFIERYDFANFNRAAADATSGVAIEPLVLLPQ